MDLSGRPPYGVRSNQYRARGASRLSIPDQPDLLGQAAAEYTADRLSRMAAHPDDLVRYQAAGNPLTPGAALAAQLGRLDSKIDSRQAAGDPIPCPAIDWETRLRIAGNPNCPPAVLEGLLSDGDRGGVALAAARNPGLPAAARAMWQLAHDT